MAMLISRPAFVLTALSGVAVLVLGGCHDDAAHTPGAGSATSSVSTPAVPGDSAAGREVLRRFTRDIWPAVVAYNGEGPSQGGPGNKAWAAITDKDLDVDAWDRVRDAVHHLSVVRDPDATHSPIAASDPLNAAETHLTALKDGTATVQVCYTFTAMSYAPDAAHPHFAPAASAADFHLRKTDAWYLAAITGQHSVPGCGADRN